MDIRDARILRCLTRHCRVPIRTNAEQLDISVAAVHQRMITLEERGIVQAYRSLVHPALFDAVALEIHGRCTVALTPAACDALARHPSVFQTVVASHDHLYVTALLRSAEERRELLDLAVRVVGMREPHVREYDLGPCPEHELTALDCAIARALSYRARRPAAELARSLGQSEKLVSRRLHRMIGSGSLIFTVTLGTSVTGSQWTKLEVRTDGSVGPRAVLDDAERSGDTQVLWVTSFSDEPSLAHAWSWSPRTSEMLRFRGALLDHPAVIVAVPAVLLTSRTHPVWLHDDLTRRAGELQPRR